MLGLGINLSRDARKAASGGSVPGAPSNLAINLASTTSSIGLSWTAGASATSHETQKSINGAAYASLHTGLATTDTDAATIGGNFMWSYKVRGVNGSGNGPFGGVASVGNALTNASAAISYPDLQLHFGSFTVAGSPTPTSFSAPVLKKMTGGLDLSGCPNLASCNCPTLVAVVGAMFFGSSTSLAFVDFSSLQTVGGDIQMHDGALTGALSFPALQTVSGLITLDTQGFSTLSMPLLTTIGGFLRIGGVSSLASINLNSLASLGGDLNLDDTQIATLSLPAMANCDGKFIGSGNESLTSLSLPVLARFTTGADFHDCTSLTSVAINAACDVVPGNSVELNFNNCALNQASVDLILQLCFNANVSDATIDLSGGSSSAPSATGGGWKSALETFGCTVLTN